MSRASIWVRNSLQANRDFWIEWLADMKSYFGEDILKGFYLIL